MALSGRNSHFEGPRGQADPWACDLIPNDLDRSSRHETANTVKLRCNRARVSEQSVERNKGGECGEQRVKALADSECGRGFSLRAMVSSCVAAIRSPVRPAVGSSFRKVPAVGSLSH
jgi:hypothetical protein